jgi:type IV pilus assembly protein PilE
MKRQRGFTLIELMIVVAVMGILVAVAIPSYRSYIITANRNAAQAQMMDIANREQQYFLSNRVYASETTLASNGYALPTEVSSNYSYVVTVGSGTVPSYTITFTAINNQVSDGNLGLTSEGVKTPTAKW